MISEAMMRDGLNRIQNELDNLSKSYWPSVEELMKKVWAVMEKATIVQPSAPPAYIREEDKEGAEPAPYFIEVDQNGCEKCGAKRSWSVVGPDGIALSTSYEDEEFVSDLVDDLNDAFAHGMGAVTAVGVLYGVPILAKTEKEQQLVLIHEWLQRAASLNPPAMELGEMTATLSEIIRLANEYGWNGVDNSKILTHFLKAELEKRKLTTEELCTEHMEHGCIKRLWELVSSSKAGLMTMKLYKEKGDRLPYRLMAFVEGQEETKEIAEALNRIEKGWNSETASMRFDVEELNKRLEEGMAEKDMKEATENITNPPTCPACGDEMIQIGETYECVNCGEKSGCS